MARNSRQAKILELISTSEIETQEELVSALKAANFDITQATISRDIKELGLIKIQTEDKKYKYAIVGSGVTTTSNKFSSIFKQCVISIKKAMNLVVVKTLKGTANMCANYLDQLSYPESLGITYGDDTVMIITSDVEDAYVIQNKLMDLLK